MVLSNIQLRNKHQHENSRKQPGLRPNRHCQNLVETDANRRTCHALHSHSMQAIEKPAEAC